MDLEEKKNEHLTEERRGKVYLINGERQRETRKQVKGYFEALDEKGNMKKDRRIHRNEEKIGKREDGKRAKL